MRVLQPLTDRIEAELMASDVLRADDTQSGFWISPAGTKDSARG